MYIKHRFLHDHSEERVKHLVAQSTLWDIKKLTHSSLGSQRNEYLNQTIDHVHHGEWPATWCTSMSLGMIHELIIITSNILVYVSTCVPVSSSQTCHAAPGGPGLPLSCLQWSPLQLHQHVPSANCESGEQHNYTIILFQCRRDGHIPNIPIAA